MLEFLLVPLTRYNTFFNVFSYISFRAAGAFFTSFMIVFLLTRPFIKMVKSRSFGQIIRDDGPESHKSKAGTPTMGGVVINLALITAIILWQDIFSPYSWLLVLTIFGFGLIGFVDDYLKISKKNSKGVSVAWKLISQTTLSAVVMAIVWYMRSEVTSLLYLPFFKDAILDLSWGYLILGMLVLVGFSNGCNLSDGLDGLAIGLIVLLGVTFAVLSYFAGHAEFADYLNIPFVRDSGDITILCAAIIGAGIGFLWYNGYPAEIFMGDTGSLALGAVIGLISMIIKKEMLLLIAGGVIVLEALSVIIQVSGFKLSKSGFRFFAMAPLHHHYEKKGWHEIKVVVRFWIFGIMLMILALSTLKIQ